MTGALNPNPVVESEATSAVQAFRREGKAALPLSNREHGRNPWIHQAPCGGLPSSKNAFET